MRGKKRGSRLGAFFTIAVILVAIYIIPPIFIGHTISQEQIPDIGGNWNANLVITSCPGCQGSTGFSPFLLGIYQSEDRVSAKANEFITQSDGEKLENFVMDGIFIDQREVQGTFLMNHQYSVSDKINGTTDWIISDDCNHITINSDFIAWKGRRIDASGTVQLTLSRVNPTGCGLKCFESFTCSDYSECVNGTQTRLCFDANQCNRTQASKTESQSCAMPVVPAPVPEKGSNLLVYILIILVILIFAAVVAFFLMKKGKRKDTGLANELSSMIEDANRLLLSGDREGALKGYGGFSEYFSKNSDKLSEMDRGKIYQEGLGLYNRLAAQ